MNEDWLFKGVKRYLMYCPFCGCTNIKGCDKTYYQNKQRGEKQTVFWYECQNCNAKSGEFISRDEANRAWNRRSIDGKSEDN